MDGQADRGEYRAVEAGEAERVFILPRAAAARGRGVVVPAAAAGERRVAEEERGDAADSVSELEAVRDLYQCV